MLEKVIVKEFESMLDSMVPGLSVDCVIIGYEDHELKILVLKWKAEGDLWGLPGGFVFKNEDLDKAAVRVLKERTGLELPFLEQFMTFGDYDRRDRKTLSKTLESIGGKTKILKWLSQRFITIGYLSLVDIQKCDLRLDFASEQIKWIPIKELRQLVFDHNQIVKSAVKHLKIQINYLPIGIQLLPEKFTMKELQKLYESILEMELDRGNFQRKMLKLGVFIRREKQLEGGAHKAPYLYSFDKEKYNMLLKQGFGFNV